MSATQDALAQGTIGSFQPQGKNVKAQRGWIWIAQGWSLFKLAPAIWIIFSVIFFVILFILIVLSLVPIVGSLVMLLGQGLAPVFAAGLVIGCRELDEGRSLKFEHLFAGFRNRTGTLIGVGLLYLIASLVIALIASAASGVNVFAVGSGMDAASDIAAMMSLLLALLITAALMIPVLMAVWFAPPLVVFNGLGAFDALKASFLGCVKNIVPFLVYSLILLGFAILASIPVFLGWLVLGPLIGASIYTSYRDIYFS